jgi:hypothetical protein
MLKKALALAGREASNAQTIEKTIADSRLVLMSLSVMPKEILMVICVKQVHTTDQHRAQETVVTSSPQATSYRGASAWT